jgi:hypothetical protein
MRLLKALARGGGYWGRDTREGGHYHAAEAGEGCYVFAGIRAAIGLEALLYISIPLSQAVAMAQA